MGIDSYAISEKQKAEVFLADATEAWSVGLLVKLARAERYGYDDGLTGPDDAWPLAALVNDTIVGPEHLAGSRELLGWDAGRRLVSDYHWDRLPTLGFVKLHQGRPVLHEEIGETLLPMTLARAVTLGLSTEAGALIRHGQPLVSKVLSAPQVTLARWAEWKVRFNDGSEGEVSWPLKDNRPIPEARQLMWLPPRRIKAL